MLHQVSFGFRVGWPYNPISFCFVLDQAILVFSWTRIIACVTSTDHEVKTTLYVIIACVTSTYH